MWWNVNHPAGRSITTGTSTLKMENLQLVSLFGWHTGTNYIAIQTSSFLNDPHTPDMTNMTNAPANPKTNKTNLLPLIPSAPCGTVCGTVRHVRHRFENPRSPWGFRARSKWRLPGPLAAHSLGGDHRLLVCSSLFARKVSGMGERCGGRCAAIDAMVGRARLVFKRSTAELHPNLEDQHTNIYQLDSSSWSSAKVLKVAHENMCMRYDMSINGILMHSAGGPRTSRTIDHERNVGYRVQTNAPLSEDFPFHTGPNLKQQFK